MCEEFATQVRKINCLLELFSPRQKLFHTFVTKSLQTLRCLLYGKDALWVRLGIELIGIAHHLFLQRLGLETWQACACMAFADPCMALVTQFAQQATTNLSMFDIRSIAIAENRRRMAPTDANIMEHGCFLHKLLIELKFRMLATNSKTTVGYLSGMKKQKTTQLVIFCIILIYNRLIVHFASRSIQASTSPLRTFAPCLTPTSTSLPPSAAGMGTISPHFSIR